MTRQMWLKTMKFVFGMAENIVGKEVNAGYQHFLLIPEISSNLELLFAMSLTLEESKICCLGKG